MVPPATVATRSLLASHAYPQPRAQLYALGMLVKTAVLTKSCRSTTRPEQALPERTQKAMVVVIPTRQRTEHWQRTTTTVRQCRRLFARRLVLVWASALLELNPVTSVTVIKRSHRPRRNSHQSFALPNAREPLVKCAVVDG